MIIWKDIKGYEGIYSVSNTGLIKSVSRKGNWTDVILKPCVYKKGYLYVNLNKNSKGKKFKIHRLVAEAFIDNPENKPCINHKDGDKTNNNDWNLEWVTNSENTQHMCYILGKTVTPIKAFLNGIFIQDFKSVREAGRILNIDSSGISGVLTGKYKQYKNYTFEKLK